MKVSTPFNHHVPKKISANLKWRAEVHRRIIEDIDYADAIRDACSKDPLFFINGFGWTYDPRREPFPKLPFILYPFQEDAILDLIRAINNHDILVEKSRDMGGSWLCILAMTWCWLFKPLQSFLFVSRVEDYVDKAGNPKAMFWKFDFFVDNLPQWLRPAGYDLNEHRKSMHVENPENGSVIDGESTQKNVARGDRRTAILLDEFAAVREGQRVLASTRDATKCRLFNSTPDPETGTNNSFYDVRQTNIKKLRLHWSVHPLKSAGLYTTDEKGDLKVLDLKGYPVDYKPILDGKLRSPWYDGECERAANGREIATELDIDYQGSGAQYFDPQKIQGLIRKYTRPSIIIGDLDFDAATGEPTTFRVDLNGKLHLWCLLDKDNKPSLDHKISIGNDVSAGTGASNSCSAGWDEVTRGKVFEYVNPYIRPEQFGKQVLAIAKWFSFKREGIIVKPRLIWESGGPGRAFGSVIEESGYGNFFLRIREESISKKVSDIPGVAQTRESKTAIMSAYRNALEKEECVNYSKESLEDTLEYVYGPDGCPTHSKASNKTDPSGAKENHGDRAMADALANKCMGERVNKPKQEKPKIPEGSLAWRNQQREQLQIKNSNDGW